MKDTKKIQKILTGFILFLEIELSWQDSQEWIMNIQVTSDDNLKTNILIILFQYEDIVIHSHCMMPQKWKF